jgi:2-iminoacetate synthase ThiH
VPLPFVHMGAPLFLQGRSRKGPTFAGALKMHRVGRFALHGYIDNVQVSWVKMGLEGAKACLNTGCNDLGGTLMNEDISRAAGPKHGQKMLPAELEAMIREAGHTPAAAPSSTTRRKENTPSGERLPTRRTGTVGRRLQQGQDRGGSEQKDPAAAKVGLPNTNCAPAR